MEVRNLHGYGTGFDRGGFIVISILPGSFDEMAVDVHTPERLGIYQSVGEYGRTGWYHTCFAYYSHVCKNCRGH